MLQLLYNRPWSVGLDFIMGVQFSVCLVQYLSLLRVLLLQPRLQHYGVPRRDIQISYKSVLVTPDVNASHLHPLR